MLSAWRECCTTQYLDRLKSLMTEGGFKEVRRRLPNRS